MDLESKSYIDKDYVWKLGGISSNTSQWTRKNLYLLEREKNVYSGWSTEWVGEIGLLYISDYGYASNNVNDCNGSIYNWYSTACSESNWIYESSLSQWALTANNENTSTVFHVSTWYGITNHERANKESSLSVKPVVYTRIELKI